MLGYGCVEGSDPSFPLSPLKAKLSPFPRYRFTATLISLILEGGYRTPHRTIDAYVEAFTGFTPTDGEHLVKREFHHLDIKDKMSTLNFEKMGESSSSLEFGDSECFKSIDHSQAGTLFTTIYEQFIYGCYTPDTFTAEQKRTFVEYGFARHKDNGTVVDEPMAILAAIKWLNQKPEFSMFTSLHQDIGKHAPGKNGFEAYLTFYLREAFETAPKLNEVFTFRRGPTQRTEPPWQRERFELVTVVASDDKGQPQDWVTTPSSGPSSELGFLADSGDKVLDWIHTNKGRRAFCFPPVSFGPDILCFVRSKESRKLLLVAIQAKKMEKIEKGDFTTGVRTVTPAWLWKSKDPKVCSFLQSVRICFV